MRKLTLKRVLVILAAVLVLALAVPCLVNTIRKDRTEQTAYTGTTVSRIRERGVLLVGTTGDYRPLTFHEADGSYWGFDIDLANIIAKELDVDVRFVPTSWPTLTSDVMATELKFDLAISGITITDQRQEIMLMSGDYLANGKTILCRKTDEDRFKSIDDVNRPDVRVMVNPGGTNEQFAKEYLSNAPVTVHQRNEEIPSLIAEGAADVMITEVTEAPFYTSSDERLAAPLVGTPFTNSYIGVLMPKGQEDLLNAVNDILQKMKLDGRLQELCSKYSLVCPL